LRRSRARTRAFALAWGACFRSRVCLGPRSGTWFRLDAGPGPDAGFPLRLRPGLGGGLRMRRRPDWALGFSLLCRKAGQGNQAQGNGKQNVGETATHEKWSAAAGAFDARRGALRRFSGASAYRHCCRELPSPTWRGWPNDGRSHHSHPQPSPSPSSRWGSDPTTRTGAMPMARMSAQSRSGGGGGTQPPA
jgi:hypothetical protein